VASAPAPAAASKPAEPTAELKAIVVTAGMHRCELGKRVLVKKVASDGASVQVNWNNKDYTLNSVPTQSGAKRFEDAKAGIAWVVISAKAFILDMKRGQMLANECKL
jgi:Membrane-bound lysozyme-inhibitor of c-type lysozyme